MQVGYYVRIEYDTPELNDAPPDPPVRERLTRTIAADQPRVTRYQINWGAQQTATASDGSAMAAEAEAGASTAAMAEAHAMAGGDDAMMDEVAMAAQGAASTPPPAMGALGAVERLMAEGAIAGADGKAAAQIGTDYLGGAEGMRLDANVPPMPMQPIAGMP